MTCLVNNNFALVSGWWGREGRDSESLSYLEGDMRFQFNAVIEKQQQIDVDIFAFFINDMQSGIVMCIS